MRKLTFIVALLLAPIAYAQTWNTLPVDYIINMNTSTPGTALTSGIVAAGFVSSSMTESAAIGTGFTVGTNQGECPNLGPIQMNGTGGTLFPSSSQNYNAIAHDDSATLTNVQLNSLGAANGTHVQSALICIHEGPPSSAGSGSDFDRYGLWAGGSNGEYSMLQRTQAGGCSLSPSLPSGYVCYRLEGKPTSHTGYFYLQPNHSYWFSFWWNDSTGTVNGQPAGTMLLHVYTIDGTPIPCATTTGCTTLTASGTQAADIITNQTAILTAGDSGGGLNHITIGNNENGSNSGTTTIFQNAMFNFTTAPFPLFWKQQDTWTGVLAPSRGVSWSNAGVVGGIPARTSPVCASLTSTATTAQITSAISSCSTSGGGVVNLAAGTYNSATSPPSFSGATNVTLRGAGANQTLFNPSGSWSLGSSLSIGSNLTTWTPGGGVGGAAPFTLTNPWPAGINTITLASSTNLQVGSLVVLDQLDQTTDWGSILVTQSSSALTAVSPGLAGPYVSQGDGQNVSRGTCGGALSGCNSQQQSVIVTQCDGVTTVGHACASGSNITINPPLLMPNWGFDLGGNSLSPSAWYASGLPSQGDGIEDLELNMASCSGCTINMIGAYNNWIKGVAFVNVSPGNTGTINTPYSLNLSLVNDYIGVSTVSGTGVYGFNAQYCTYCLIQNNIVQGVPTPFIFNGGGIGNVWSYNYAINGFYTASSQYNIPAFGDHAAGIAKNLIEGSMTNGHTQDSIHGVSDFQTDFRNNFWGTYPACWVSGSSEGTSTYGQCTQNMTPENDSGGHRLFSSIGNILGTSGVETLYSTTSFATGSGPYAIYQYGSQTVAVADSANLQQTEVQWGSADVVTGFATPRFNCTDINTGTAWSAYGTSIGAFQQQRLYNPCPTSHTLPSSFFYSSTPSWWPNSKPFPPVGPDVTGGNLLQCTSGTYNRSLVTNASQCSGGTSSAWANGYVYSNPAMDCYLNTMAGNPDGTGGPYSFNESTCYSAVPAPLVSLNPTSLSFANQVVLTSSSSQAVTLTNVGTAVLNISSIAIGGANPSSWSETNTCGSTLAVNASCTINVTFTPTTTASLPASVVVTTNAASSPDSVSLSGTGVPSVIVNPPTSITFQIQALGVISTPSVIVQLTNTSSAGTLTMTSIALSGTNSSDFSIPVTGTTCPLGSGSLNAGASCTVAVAFTPTLTSTETAALTFTTNAISSPNTLSLSGTGGTFVNLQGVGSIFGTGTIKP